VIEGVTGTVAWNGNVATFTPSLPLTYNGAYAATVYGADIAGNPIELSWTFNTTKVGNIAGIIADEKGNALSNVTVMLSGGATVVTGVDGRFLFENLALGSYTITVAIEGYETFTAQATVEEADVDDLGALTMTSEESDDAEDNGIPFYLIVIPIVIFGAACVLFLIKRR
jgi:hypothetical protein